MANKINIKFQNVTQFQSLPVLSQVQEWIHSVFQFIPSYSRSSSELTIRFIDKKESAELNKTYRYKNGPTNILSFPDESIPGFSSTSLGDLAICAPLVDEEATAQNKMLESHFAHLIIHGLLHLLGYDHIEEEDAKGMEELEIKILSKLNYKNPYDYE
ncbi:rRNA maturation RNase YbeY [Coxiella endosymbiont of Amblyomma nuttalli]|uniref:rRNA maturation RNase YbeY n=1 Tax=Coxiella endosymbiont of Amblyomma nuttalli TaxID=2749996 RepID=UPI001BA57A00|nr:rRNA maturation RNase YbeY [Coxiella endosymbiont of Amblyomma nuttalli]QTS83891.1 Endoribonuclease YbeY [Coxiella endosymbiont of Amblyomma nuttalli]